MGGDLITSPAQRVGVIDHWCCQIPTHPLILVILPDSHAEPEPVFLTNTAWISLIKSTSLGMSDMIQYLCLLFSLHLVCEVI